MAEDIYPHVYGKIRHLFKPAMLDESQIKEEYINLESPKVLQASKIRDDLVSIIEKVQLQCGIEANVLDATQEQRGIFIQKLKSDSQWFESFRNILNLFDVDAAPEKVVQDINRPWWNALQVNLSEDKYSPQEGYSFTGKVSHSFIAMLGDSVSKSKTLPKYNVQTKFQPVSIGNILLTSDNKIVLGYRGGQNFSDVIMVVPAGSAEPHLERGAVWGSYDKEILEELKFTKKDYQSAELVGRATESLLARGGWHYWIFKTKTQMTSEQVKDYWLTAVDRKEHKHLEVYDAEPEKLLSLMKAKQWDIAKADQKSMSKTTPENKGTWLPQCSLCVLTPYVQQLGPKWARHAQDYLEGHYDLTSCFDK